MVQAANGIGDVSLNNNQGSFFTAASGGAQGTPPTLTLSGASSAVFGSTATVSATLNSASGTPLAGRQVSFAIGSDSAIAVTGSTGTATAQVPLTGLAAGGVTLTASFPGDSTNSPASASSPFTVSQAPTTLTLSLPSSGQIIIGRANGMSATLTSSGAGVAQRTVYFVVSDSSGNVLGGSVGQTNQNGVAQAGVITLPANLVGTTENVTAYFGSPTIPFPSGQIYNAPDPDYLASNSAPAAATILGAIDVSVSGTEVYGQSPTFSYTSNAPSGVSLSGPLSCTTEGGGTGVVGLTPGTYTLDAKNCTGLSASSPGYLVDYVGVSNGFAVSQANQTVTFTSQAPTNALVSGATYTPTASSTSGLAVSITVDTSASSVCSIDSSGMVSFVSPGTCVLDANQAGNSNYNAANQAQQSFSVQAVITISVSGTEVYGQSPTFSYTSNAPSGVSLSGPLSCTTEGGGTALTGLSPGNYTLDAVNCGGLSASRPGYIVNYLGVSNGFAVSQANQTVTFTSQAPTNALVSGATYTPTASSTSGLAVSITVDTSASSVCSIDSSGMVSFVSPGTCVLDANQAGNSNYNAGSQAQQSFSVQAVVTVSVSGSQVYGSSSPTFAVSGISGGPSSAVVGTPSCTAVMGPASINSSLGAGSYTIDGTSCKGLSLNDPNHFYVLLVVGAFNGFQVSQANQTVTVTTPAPTNALVGGATYTPAASSTSGLPVSITVDSSASSVCSIDSSGVVSLLQSGTCVLNANQAGNNNYSAATQAQQSFAVSTMVFILANPPTTAYSGLTYTYVFAANSSSTVTYSLAAGSASFLSIDPSTGLVTGAPPSKVKSFTYSVVATNNAGSVTTGPFTVTVSSTQGLGAGLSVALSCPAGASAGSPVSCTVTVNNNGPNTAQNVIVWVSIPAGLGNVSLSNGGNLYGQWGYWNVTSLATKATASFTVNGTATVSNTSAKMTAIVVSTVNPDSKFADNVATVSMQL
jgi:uncharacterized repeat protein (TIGR01451 family)